MPHSNYEFRRGFDEMLVEMDGERDKNGDALSMLYVGASHNGLSLSSVYGGSAEAVDLRSVSKVVLSLVLGALIDSGISQDGQRVTPETLVYPLLEQHFTRVNDAANWSGVKIRHLLSNTIGHEEGFFFRKDLVEVTDDDYVGYALRRPIVHQPGVHFSYSNVGPYLISVILEDLTGESLEHLAGRLILNPLGIASSWRTYGSYVAGCTGLTMNGRDLLTLAKVIRSEGVLNGNPIVSAEWLRAATTIQAKSPLMYDPSRLFPKFGYGFGFWICEDGSFYTDGTDGQYLIVCPSIDLVIVTTGRQADMKPITRAMRPLLDTLRGFRGGSSR